MGKVYVLCLKPQHLRVAKCGGFFFPSNKCQQAFLRTVFYNNFENISKGIEVKGDKIRIVVVLRDPEML